MPVNDERLLKWQLTFFQISSFLKAFMYILAEKKVS